MKKNTNKKIVSGYIRKKENNMLHVIVKAAKYNVEYIIDCNFIVKNTNNVFSNDLGYIPRDLQECGTNVFVYNNANVNDMVAFDINAAQYKGNRTYYVPANTGWDEKHDCSKSSIISLNDRKALDFVPRWYMNLQKETTLRGYYFTGSEYQPFYDVTAAASIRANRVREHMECKNEMRIQKTLKALRQR